MYEFHGNKQRYFDMTHQVTVGHIIPFTEQLVVSCRYDRFGNWLR